MGIGFTAIRFDFSAVASFDTAFSRLRTNGLSFAFAKSNYPFALSRPRSGRIEGGAA